MVYGTLQNAIEACDKDKECQFIYDSECDEDSFKHCNNPPSLYPSSAGSCVHQKPSKSMMLPITIIVFEVLFGMFAPSVIIMNNFSRMDSSSRQKRMRWRLYKQRKISFN